MRVIGYGSHWLKELQAMLKVILNQYRGFKINNSFILIVSFNFPVQGENVLAPPPGALTSLLTKYKKRKTMRMLRDLKDDLKSECYIMHA